jgi:hypothetical protein
VRQVQQEAAVTVEMVDTLKLRKFQRLYFALLVAAVVVVLLLITIQVQQALPLTGLLSAVSLQEPAVTVLLVSIAQLSAAAVVERQALLVMAVMPAEQLLERMAAATLTTGTIIAALARQDAPHQKITESPVLGSEPVALAVLQPMAQTTAEVLDIEA